MRRPCHREVSIIASPSFAGSDASRFSDTLRRRSRRMSLNSSGSEVNSLPWALISSSARMRPTLFGMDPILFPSTRALTNVSPCSAQLLRVPAEDSPPATRGLKPLHYTMLKLSS